MGEQVLCLKGGNVQGVKECAYYKSEFVSTKQMKLLLKDENI